MANRVYIPVSIRDYAKAKGISERTARRRASSIVGATQSRRTKHWTLPLTAKEYAQSQGITERTARRKGISATSLSDWALTVKASEKPSRRELRAAKHYARLASKYAKRRISEKRSQERMRHASNRQIDIILGLTDDDFESSDTWYYDLYESYDDYGGEDEHFWDGDDGIPILYVY